MARFEANAALVAIVYDAGSDPAPLVRRIVDMVVARGGRVIGFIQRDVERPGRPRCDMILDDIATADALPISEDRGAEARGCRLDEARLGAVAATAVQALASGPDLLVLNKFGKSEAEGRGFRPLIASAVEAKVPVLVPVPSRCIDSWRQFTDDFAEEHDLRSLVELGEAQLAEVLGFTFGAGRPVGLPAGA